MKTYISKLLLCAMTIIAVVVCTSCDEKKIYISDKEYKVRKVINGNTIILDNMLKVKLLGIKDTPSSYQFLQQEVKGHKVRLKPDSKHQNFYVDATTDSVFAHVNLVISAHKSLELNGHMLKKGFAKFGQKPNNDSAKVYKEYAELVPSEKMTDEQLCLKMTPATFLVESRTGIGTGFFISEDGLALTNNHVLPDIDNASLLYKVYLSDEFGNISRDKMRPVARALYTNHEYDFTIFRVQLDPDEKSPGLFVSRNEPTRGQHVGVVGNPRGLTATFSTGELSAFRPDNNGYPHSIQFTAPVYPGNSGGPVCDEYGIVIGIVKSVAANEKGEIITGNMNFGVDIRVVRAKLDQLGDVKTYNGK